MTYALVSFGSFLVGLAVRNLWGLFRSINLCGPVETPVETPWESKRTQDTRRVEDFLRYNRFSQVDAYYYGTIRLRVIDWCFEGLDPERRREIIKPHLEKSLKNCTLYLFTPSEIQDVTSREAEMNRIFENPKL